MGAFVFAQRLLFLYNPGNDGQLAYMAPSSFKSIYIIFTA